MRPVIAVLLALLLAIPGQIMAAEGPERSPYDDVPRDHWSYAAMDYLTDIGVLEGYPEDFFESDRTLTCFEFAQGVLRAEDKLADFKVGNRDYPVHVVVMINDLHNEYLDQIENYERTISICIIE